MELILLKKLGHQLWKLNSVCQGKFDKIHDPDPESRSLTQISMAMLHCCLKATSCKRCEQARWCHKTTVKRSLCSSGQACSLQSKCQFLLCYFCRRLLFSLMTIVQSSTTLCPLFRRLQRDMCSSHCHWKTVQQWPKQKCLKLPGFLEWQRWILQKSLF